MGYLQFILRFPRFLSFGFTVYVSCAVGQTFYISLFNGEMQTAFDLSNGELAAIYGTGTMLASFLVLYGGRLLDVLDLRVAIAGVCVLVALSCWLIAVSFAVWVLFVAMFALRFSAQGMLGMTAQVAMGRYFEEERGKAAAIANAGMALGFAVFPAIGAWLLETYGWRQAWALTGAAFVMIMIPLVLLQLSGHGERHRRYVARLAELAEAPQLKAVRQWRRAEVLRDPRFWLLQPSILAMPSIVFTIQFHQLYLVAEKGWDLTVFAGGYTLYALCAFICNVAVGPLIDRKGSWSIVTVYLWPLIPALLALGYSAEGWVIPAVMVGTGLTTGLTQVIFITLWAEMYGTEHIGAIRAVNVFLNVATASAVMVLTGWLIDMGVTIRAMCLGGVFYVLLSIVLLHLARRFERRPV